MTGKLSITRFSRWGENLGKPSVTDAKHEEALDGTDKLTITCAEELSKGDRVVWFDRRGVCHEHIVDEPRRTHDESGAPYTVATCINSIAELWDDWVEDKVPSGTVAVALAAALQQTRWQVGTCDQPGSASRKLYHQSAREALADICETWGGEIETQITADGSGVTSRKVGIRAARGNQSSPKRFTWTKDLVSIERAVGSDNPKTRVYGYGKGVETDGGGYGRRLTFGSVNGGRDYVEDATATRIWGHPDGKGGIIPAVGSYVNEQCEDARQLLAETKAYLKEACEPKVTYTADVVDLYAFGRSWEGVEVGDKVAVIDKGFCDGGIRLTGRVSKIDRDLLTGETTVTFGNLADAMADMWQSMTKALNASASRSALYDAVAGASPGWLQLLQQSLNEQFNAAGTYHVETFELGEVWSNVPLDGSTGLPVRETSNMWAMNVNGRGFRLASGLASDGQWDWRTFGTGDGFTADCINAGTLNADLIRAGTLMDAEGINRWNLASGALVTHGMTANDITANGVFRCGDESDYTLLDASGKMSGYEDGIRVGFVDFSAGSYYTDEGKTYKGLQLQGNGTLRIATPALCVSASSDASAPARVAKTGTCTKQVVLSAKQNSNGTISITSGPLGLQFVNGFCVSY